MNAHSSLLLAIPLALLLPIGCNNGGTANSDPAPEAVAAAPAAEAAAATPSHHRRHHARGPAAMIFRAANALEVSADQRTTIDKLAADLHSDRPAMRSAQQALHTALVAGVRTGNVDLATLAPLQAAVNQARQAHQAREASSLNALYAALQPAQRQALVASVRERQSERAAKWQAERAERAAAPEGSQRVAHLTNELGLDAAQQASLAAVTANNERPVGVAAHHDLQRITMTAILDAFASDTFNASTFDLGGHEASMGRGQHQAAFLTKLVPILRADQRAALAASMETPRG